ncbi:MAG: flippase [candidate division KSB1 bacterium]|nr:flippase [candidate division KSB1 bacterium]MDZ7334584.1 flippase [candidate division KSB1 bacterium]MDZ7356737.1 flippase [candidate division KSB1 bacterium]MDZ7399926.1 flippase [candidate division KSB1 bacterium]
MHVAKRITQNFLWLSIGEAIANGLAFLSTVYLSRTLTEIGFGKIAFAQAVATYLLLFVHAGLPTFGIREIAKYRERVKEFYINIAALRLLLAIFIFISSALVIWQLHLAKEMKILLTSFALLVFSQAIFSDFAFQGAEKMEIAAIGRSLVQLLFLISIFIFIKSSDDITSVPMLKFGSELIAGIALLVIFFVQFGRCSEKDVKFSDWKAYLKEAWVIAASLILINVYYTFDTLLLGLLNQAAVVGWYNAAYKVIMLFVGIAGLLQLAFAPFFASEKDNQPLFKKGMAGFSMALLFLSALICGMLFFGSEDLVLFLYGKSYLPSISILRLLSISLFFIYLDTIFLSPLLFTGFQKYYLISVLIGAISNIVLNLILIPIWSYKGAAIASICSNFAIALSGAVFFARSFYFDHRLLIKMMMGIVTLALVTFMIHHLQLRPLLSVGLFVLVFSASFLMQYKNDVDFLIQKIKL